MDVSTVSKSFQYFYEKVLPRALSSPGFSEEGITNAFLWADFCEKLHGRLDEESRLTLNKDLRGKFQTDEKQFTSNLCHAFLQNPSIDRNALKTTLSRIKPNHLNLSEIWEDAVELDSLCVKLIESLRPISLKETDRSLYHELKSELFVDFLKDFAHQTEGQLETHLNLLFETLCESEDTMIVLLNILCESEESEIQTFAVHWVLLHLTADGRLAQFLWRQHPSKLRAVAIHHPMFCSYYLNFLTQSASSMCSVCEGGGKEWKPDTTTVFEVSFREIVEHFEVLTCSQDDMGREILSHLRTLARSGAIWKDIFSAIT